MTSTDIAVRPEYDAPALYQPVPVTSSDTPSIYVMNGLSTLVGDGIAKPGQVVLAIGADDPEPTFLVENRDTDSFTAYILSRSVDYARFHQGGDMEWIDKAEYEAAVAAHERDAWQVFRFFVAIPEVDDLIPAKLMLTKTSGLKPARRINYFIDRAIAEGDTNPVAIKFTCVEQVGRQSKQKYYALNVAKAAPTKDGLEVALRLRDLVARSTYRDDEAPAAASQPAI